MSTSKYFERTNHHARRAVLPALAAVDQDEPAGQLRTFCLLCGARGVAATCRRCGSRTIVEVIVRERAAAAKAVS